MDINNNSIFRPSSQPEPSASRQASGNAQGPNLSQIARASGDENGRRLIPLYALRDMQSLMGPQDRRGAVLGIRSLPPGNYFDSDDSSDDGSATTTTRLEGNNNVFDLMAYVQANLPEVSALDQENRAVLPEIVVNYDQLPTVSRSVVEPDGQDPRICSITHNTHSEIEAEGAKAVYLPAGNSFHLYQLNTLLEWLEHHQKLPLPVITSALVDSNQPFGPQARGVSVSQRSAQIGAWLQQNLHRSVPD